MRRALFVPGNPEHTIPLYRSTQRNDVLFEMAAVMGKKKWMPSH